MPPSLSIPSSQVSQLAKVIADPVSFSQGILQHRTWKLQREIMRSVASNPLTAVKACHASGKTFTAAELTLWWITAHHDGIVITTAPSWNQVENVLWPEIRTSAKNSRIKMPDGSATTLRISDKRYAMGLSTNEGVRFQGFHGKILIILDEAPGVKPEIWEAIEGIRAGGDVRLLALGNPTISSGPFYDAFTRERALWKTFTISAFSTPNFTYDNTTGIERLLELAANTDNPDDSLGDLGEDITPYLTRRRWVYERYIKWGPNNPLYQARVLGQFPVQSDDTVYSLAWIEEASNREFLSTDPSLQGMPIQVGLDIAGPGEDETVLYARRGGQILRFRSWCVPDPRGNIISELYSIQREYRTQIGPVVVDSNGIGYHVATHLLDHNFDVRFANAGAKALDADRFSNLKAEMTWTLRECLENNLVGGLHDEETKAQLAGIRYAHTPRGRVEIESKDDARRRGVQSPDRAEALIMAFANVPVPSFEGTAVYDKPVRISRF